MRSLTLPHHLFVPSSTHWSNDILDSVVESSLDCRKFAYMSLRRAGFFRLAWGGSLAALVCCDYSSW